MRTGSGLLGCVGRRRYAHSPMRCAPPYGQAARPWPSQCPGHCADRRNELGVAGPYAKRCCGRPLAEATGKSLGRRTVDAIGKAKHTVVGAPKDCHEAFNALVRACPTRSKDQADCLIDHGVREGDLWHMTDLPKNRPRKTLKAGALCRRLPLMAPGRHRGHRVAGRRWRAPEHPARWSR